MFQPMDCADTDGKQPKDNREAEIEGYEVIFNWRCSSAWHQNALVGGEAADLAHGPDKSRQESGWLLGCLGAGVWRLNAVLDHHASCIMTQNSFD